SALRGGEQVGTVDVDQPDRSEEGVDDLRGSDAAPTGGAVHLRMQEVGGDHIVPGELPAVEGLPHRLHAGLIDQDLQDGRGVQVDDHRSPRRSSRTSLLLRPWASGRAARSTFFAPVTRCYPVGARGGEARSAIRGASVRPWLVRAGASPSSPGWSVSVLLSRRSVSGLVPMSPPSTRSATSLWKTVAMPPPPQQLRGT